MSDADTNQSNTSNDIVVTGTKKWGYGNILNTASSPGRASIEQDHKLKEAMSFIAPSDSTMHNTFEGEIYAGSMIGSTVEVNIMRANTAQIGVQQGSDTKVTIAGTNGNDFLQGYVFGEAQPGASSKPHFTLKGGEGNDTTAITDVTPDKVTITRTGENTYGVSTPTADYSLDSVEFLKGRPGQEVKSPERDQPLNGDAIPSQVQTEGVNLNYLNLPIGQSITLSDAMKPQMENDPALKQAMDFERCMNQYREQGGGTPDQVKACVDSTGVALNFDHNTRASSPSNQQNNKAPEQAAPGPSL